MVILIVTMMVIKMKEKHNLIGPLSWFNSLYLALKKQIVVSTSTYEVEYVEEAFII